jgi:hypothetical protein
MICHLRDWMEINEIVRLRHSRMPMQMAKGAEAHSASMVADSSS